MGVTYFQLTPKKLGGAKAYPPTFSRTRRLGALGMLVGDISAHTRRLADTTVSCAITTDANYHYPNKLKLAENSDKLGQEGTLGRQQLSANAESDEQLFEPVWQSFRVLLSKLETFYSKLYTLTVESAVLPPEPATASSTDPTPSSTPSATISGGAGALPALTSPQRPQRKPRARIEYAQEVETAAENVRSQLTQYLSLREREINMQVAPTAAAANSQSTNSESKEEMERKQGSVLRALTAVSRVQFVFSRLSTNPTLYLPHAPLSPMQSLNTAANDRCKLVHAYMVTVGNAIRNALREKQYNSLDQLMETLTIECIALWKNLGCRHY